MRRLTKKRRAIAEDTLAEARIAQTAFWSALTDLEEALGIEIDGTRDLEEVDMDDLIESGRKNDIATQ